MNAERALSLTTLLNNSRECLTLNPFHLSPSRQESQYEMTGLYSETQDDSSADLPQDTETESLPSTITVTTNFNPALTQTVTVSTTLTNPAVTTTSITSSVVPDTVMIKCHSRQPSSSLMDREKTHSGDELEDEDLNDCGILSCRPAKMQKLARIKVCSALPRDFSLVCIECQRSRSRAGNSAESR